ncbi:hypothetical protein ACOMHN_065475 [Nucella lapillus]
MHCSSPRPGSQWRSLWQESVGPCTAPPHVPAFSGGVCGRSLWGHALLVPTSRHSVEESVAGVCGAMHCSSPIPAFSGGVCGRSLWGHALLLPTSRHSVEVSVAGVCGAMHCSSPRPGIQWRSLWQESVGPCTAPPHVPAVSGGACGRSLWGHALLLPTSRQSVVFAVILHLLVFAVI